MRAVVQRVTRAAVLVDRQVIGEIAGGLVVLLGIARDDTENGVAYLVDKTISLRIFDDEQGRMNRSLQDVGGGILIVSQFTLYGDVRRGLRPSWIDAAAPEVAKPLYDLFVTRAQQSISQVATGSFGANMQLELVNDGPVTILLDSRKLV